MPFVLLKDSANLLVVILSQNKRLSDLELPPEIVIDFSEFRVITYYYLSKNFILVSYGVN